MDNKLRNLWSDDPDGKITFKDVIDIFIEGQDYIQKLETKNTMHAVVKVKTINQRALHAMKQFQLRINNEVAPEVVEEISNLPKRKINGNPNKLIEHNNKRLGRNDPFREYNK